MFLEANKAVVRRYYEEIGNQRKLEVADEIFAPECKMFPDAEPPYGAEGVKQFMGWFTSVFPDVQASIDMMLAEGDMVAVGVTLRATHSTPITYMTGFGTLEPTGKSFALKEYVFWRVVDGKIVERSFLSDALDMLYQLGAVGTTP